MVIHYLVLIALMPLSYISQEKKYADIFKTDNIYFYGYDFSHFKFIEAKRENQGQQIKVFIFELIDLMNADNDEKAYQKLFKKERVLFSQNTVTELNTKIDPNEIMGFMRNKIPEDSLQGIINQYDTQGTTGIGFVQIVECFYRPKKEALVWYVFFDIYTKNILWAYENSNFDADSYHGLATYWKVGMTIGMGEFTAQYRKERKVFAE